MFQELFLSELLSIMTVEWAETCGGKASTRTPKAKFCSSTHYRCDFGRIKLPLSLFRIFLIQN